MIHHPSALSRRDQPSRRLQPLVASNTLYLVAHPHPLVGDTLERVETLLLNWMICREGAEPRKRCRNANPGRLERVKVGRVAGQDESMCRGLRISESCEEALLLEEYLARVFDHPGGARRPCGGPVRDRPDDQDEYGSGESGGDLGAQWQDQAVAHLANLLHPRVGHEGHEEKRRTRRTTGKN